MTSSLSSSSTSTCALSWSFSQTTFATPSSRSFCSTTTTTTRQIHCNSRDSSSRVDATSHVASACHAIVLTRTGLADVMTLLTAERRFEESFRALRMAFAVGQLPVLRALDALVTSRSAARVTAQIAFGARSAVAVVTALRIHLRTKADDTEMVMSLSTDKPEKKSERSGRNENEGCL